GRQGGALRAPRADASARPPGLGAPGRRAPAPGAAALDQFGSSGIHRGRMLLLASLSPVWSETGQSTRPDNPPDVPYYPGRVHKTLGQRDPAAAFPLARVRNDADERRQANRAIAVSALGLGATG